MIDILLVRHAHTYWNAQRQIGYSWATDRLDEKWYSQIPQLGKKLSHRIRSLLNSRKRRVYLHRSDTNRTRQTLEYSLKNLEWIDCKIVTPHLDLWEIDMWDMIGKIIDRDIYQRVFTSTHQRFPNGESRKDVAERMKRYLSSLDDDAIHVVFSHGVAISCTVHEILWDYTKRIKIMNASMSHIRLDRSRIPEILAIDE